MDDALSRYIIGIDLGTTNSAVAYVDMDPSVNPSLSTQIFSIPQLTDSGRVAALSTLPSYYYTALDSEFPKGTLNLPWREGSDEIVGSFAKAQGARVPGRIIQSVKSWLCNSAADRKEKFLPFEGETKLSPLETTAKYLRHIKEAWNHLMAKKNPLAEFDQQEVILTVPASFDEVARTLTVEAARLAGFAKMTLLEEPQAAFYHWIAEQKGKWQKKVSEGDKILVVDVGGGTTDFTMIEVLKKEEELTFQRMAVGNHLLLGGDNMDVALSYHIEKKMQEKGRSFSSEQWQQLKYHARVAKEKLLEGEDSYSVVLQGEGSHVIAGSRRCELKRKEVLEFLLQGFFAKYPFEEAAKIIPSSAVRKMGLPYENDPSITKHLAAFLKNTVSSQSAPNFLFFNGGTMTPQPFQKAIIESLQEWFPEGRVETLSSQSLDLAVARGAAYFGKARRGKGVRIVSGTPRGYYLVINVPGEGKKALTLLPKGSRDGSRYLSEHSLMLLPNRPVTFDLLTSEQRLDDQSGDIVEISEEEFSLLPPMQTVLRFGKGKAKAGEEKIPVQLEITLSEIGILELILRSTKSNHRWALPFQLRSMTGQEDSLHARVKTSVGELWEEGALEEAEEVITKNYQAEKIGRLMAALEKAIGKPRKEWSSATLRGLWKVAHHHAEVRERSHDHEARWWNLAGYLLRPGFGLPLDDFRVKELWKIILSDYKKEKSHDCMVQRWICYRRIAGGLNKGQQLQLAAKLIPAVTAKEKGNPFEYAEQVRALAAMELLDLKSKEEIGNYLLKRILSGKGLPCEFWALGRIGARHLVYGSLGNLLSPFVISSWVEKILHVKGLDRDETAFLLSQLARKTDQREVNLSEELFEEVAEWLSQCEGKEHLAEVIHQESSLTQQEQERIVGDSLPVGLSLEN